MEQQSNNVGGQSMGMANSGPALNNRTEHTTHYAAADAFPTQQSQPQMQPPVAPSVAASDPQNDANAVDLNNNDVSNATLPSVADDSDLIEKEWVEKAKKIVEKTQRDPFSQSHQLNQLKAEYLQKRYGKNVGADGQES